MNLQTIDKQMLICEEQINLLKNGKKVAGTHARQALLTVKKECDRLIIRREVHICIRTREGHDTQQGERT